MIHHIRLLAGHLVEQAEMAYEVLGHSAAGIRMEIQALRQLLGDLSHSVFGLSGGDRILWAQTNMDLNWTR